MPDITISDSLYKRLQSIAIPLEDTAETSIERLLNEYENRLRPINYLDEPDEDFAPSRLALLLATDLDPNRPPNLYHTKVLQATLNGIVVHRPKWKKIVHKAHQIALQKGMSIDDLIALSSSNVVRGMRDDSGFDPLQGLGISIQGMDANRAWNDSLELMQYLGLPIEVYVQWRNKEEAACPNEIGLLFWTPD